MPGHLFEGNPVDEGTTRRDTDIPMHRLEKPADSTHTLPPLCPSLALLTQDQGGNGGRGYAAGTEQEGVRDAEAWGGGHGGLLMPQRGRLSAAPAVPSHLPDLGCVRAC